MANLIIAQTIKQQLLAGGMIKVMSWGANSFVGSEEGKFLQFKVQGYLFKGFVKITLDECMDLYNIEFIKKSGEVVKKLEGMYCDQLTEVIDNFVERKA